jgi:hypothetical protein
VLAPKVNSGAAADPQHTGSHRRSTRINAAHYTVQYAHDGIRIHFKIETHANEFIARLALIQKIAAGQVNDSSKKRKRGHDDNKPES